jgi:nucleotide exchange factor SIL1
LGLSTFNLPSRRGVLHNPYFTTSIPSFIQRIIVERLALLKATTGPSVALGRCHQFFSLSVMPSKRGSSWKAYLPLTLIVVFLFVSLATPLVSAAGSSGASVSSSDESDLICHTDNPDECYPRVFQPTNEFQTVHEDQQLPSGLHVRLNIWTGLKEAKINDPTEENPSLEGLPVDRSVVIVDPEADPVERIPHGAPAYEPVGKIKKPPQETGDFQAALSMLKKGARSNSKAFDDALEALEDISHDLYYGLKIAEDTDAVKSLFCLMIDGDSDSISDGASLRNFQAASIIGGSLQNNPTALEQISNSWTSLMTSKCLKNKEPLSVGFYRSFMPSDGLSVDELRLATAMVKARVSAINGLIKNAEIRREFLENGGMQRLLEVMIPEGKEWESVQKKIGLFALDNFLDEGMGATLGEWPRGQLLGSDICGAKESQANDGCWNYHVTKIKERNANDKDHWSLELSQKLRSQGKETGDGNRIRDEL